MSDPSWEFCQQLATFLSSTSLGLTPSLPPTLGDGNCWFRAELSPAPEIREISRIRGISGNSTENSTENSVLFSKWLKTPKKSFRMLPSGPKSSKNSTEFLYFFQKSSWKAQSFRKMYNATVAALKTPHKSYRKSPEFWRNSNLATALVSRPGYTGNAPFDRQFLLRVNF